MPAPVASVAPSLKRQRAVKIYESPERAPFFPQLNVFDLLLPSSPGVSPLHGYTPCLPALSGPYGRLSRGELRSAALGFAASVKVRYGLRRGDSALVLASRLSVDGVVATLGLFAAGVKVLMVGEDVTPRELGRQAEETKAKLAIVEEGLRDRLDEAKTLPRLEVVPLSAAYDGLECTPERFSGPDAHTTAIVSYSAHGTVETSHYNLTSSLVSGSVGMELGPGDVVFSSLCSDVCGLLSVLQPLALGAEVALPHPHPEGSPEASLSRAMEEYGVTAAILPPPLLASLDPAADLSSLRTIITTGAIPRRLRRKLEESLPDALVLRGHGSVQTTGLIFAPSPDSTEDAGSLLPGLQARIVDNGWDADRGELWIRGPTVMARFHLPTCTKPGLDEEGGGWYRTGDVVTPRGGRWVVVDRVADMIPSRGRVVAPAEIERVLLQHPAVGDAAVVGLERGGRWGEHEAEMEIRAYLVLESGRVGPQHVMRWVQGRVSRPKWVASVVVLEEVPRGRMGEVRRGELKRRAMEGRDDVHYYEAGKLSKL